jgi:hypothetical protein
MRETKRCLEYTGTEQSLRKYLIKTVKDARKVKSVLEDSEEEFSPDDSEAESIADDDVGVLSGNKARPVVIEISDDSEDDGVHQNGRTPKAANQGVTINPVSDDEDGVAVSTGEKRKYAGTAPTAMKDRRLDDTKRSGCVSTENDRANQTQSGDMRVRIVDNSDADNRLSCLLAGLKINSEDRPTPNSQPYLLVRLKTRPNTRPVPANQPSRLVRPKVRTDRRPATTNQPSLIVRLKVKNRHEKFETYRRLLKAGREKTPAHIRQPGQPHRCGPHCSQFMGGLEHRQQSESAQASSAPMKYEGFAGLY